MNGSRDPVRAGLRLGLALGRSRVATMVAACFAWIVICAPARADELSDVVDRYRTWRGGENFERIETIRLEGRISTSGLNGSTKIIATSEGDLRRDIDLGVVSMGDARRGADGWSLTQAGQLEVLAPSVAEDLRRDALLMFDDVLDDQERLTLTKGVERDGRSFDVVRIDFRGPDVFELYIEPGSGALYGVRTVRERSEGFTRYEDWRLVRGVRMPFIQREVREGESPATVTWTTVQIDPGIAPDAFDKPSVGARHTFVGGVSTTGPMAFEFVGGTRIYLPATVGGVTTEVLLDSGAEMTVLDLAFARSLGLQLEGDVVVTGTGGESHAWYARGVDIEVGSLKFDDLTVLVIDMGPIGAAIGRPLHVVLGKEAFNALIVDVNFPERQVAFHELEGFAPPSGAHEIELMSTGDGRAVRLSLEGRPPEWVDFDTGNGGALLVFPAYAEASGLLNGKPSTTIFSGAVGGAQESRLATLRSVDLAGFEVRDVPTVFPPAGISAVNSDRVVGNIGLGILGRFRVITDFAGGRAWLAPDATALAQPFTRDRLGLALSRDGGAIKVDRVSPRSPAAEGGWLAGDRILAIDGVAADDLTPELLRAIRTGPANRTVRFQLEGGVLRTLRSRDFY